MSDDSIITTITPIHVGLIKYYEHPKIRTLYPINDYLVATLDPDIICTKSSVCARQEFTEDEFWLNGKKCTTQFAFCLNEVKYRAANQRSVSIEFLKRKVHVACENKFLPSTGSSSFSAGFICLMSALCKLYKIKPDSIRNCAPFPDLTSFHWGGFVQRRDTITTRNHFKGKLISEGKNWPELRVLLLVLQPQVRQTEIRHGITIPEHTYRRFQETVPANLKKIIKAIKAKDFETFSETLITDNDQFHYVNIDTCPLRDYKTEVSHMIEKLIKIYNEYCGDTKIGYIYDTGPNPTLFFLEKDAKQIISFLQYMFPSSNPNFFKGLNVPRLLNAEHFSNFGMDPMESDLIQYAIYTKIGNVSVQFMTENHLLDENGDAINKVPTSPNQILPTSVTAAFSANLDTTTGAEEVLPI